MHNINALIFKLHTFPVCSYRVKKMKRLKEGKSNQLLIHFCGKSRNDVLDADIEKRIKTSTAVAENRETKQ